MKRKKILLLAGGLLVVLAAVILWRKRAPLETPAALAPRPAPWSVLLITLDTVRADRIGAYGYRQGRTPAIDALAAEGIRFARAQSPVPLTLPAHTSLLTGTYPPRHGLRTNGGYALPPEAETLAEILKARGYRTAAFVSSFVLDSRFGLDQGFDVYGDRMNTAGAVKDLQSERAAAEVFSDFDAWLPSVDGTAPFFCWLHFYDPHLPYEPPEPFKSDPALSPYDGEIANVDLAVSRVLERLRNRGLYDTTLVVAAGDHGEGFGEHGESGHGIFCYQETLAVPLIVRIPGAPPAVVEDYCDLTDVMPTILSAVGATVPASVQGRALFPPAVPEKTAERELYFESYYARESLGAAPLAGLLKSGWKYIDLPRAECYDLRSDPAESRNLMTWESARAQGLRDRLSAWRAPGRQNEAALRTVSAEEKRRLESLGYLSTASPRPAEAAPPDPKDLLPGWTENALGKTLLDAGDPKGAEEHFLRAIELLPAFFNPYIDVSRIRLSRGDIPGGLAVLKQGVARNPGDASVKIEYARALDEADRPAEALAVLREAEKQMVYGQHETVQVMLGAALSRLDRFAEAADALRRALDIEPDNAGTARDLGYCLFRAGRFTEAVPYYTRAEAALPDDPVIPAELALCQASLKEYGAAAQSFERALRLQPSQETYFNYAFMTAETGDFAKAMDLMARSLEQTPRNPRLASRGSALLEEWKGRARR